MTVLNEHLEHEINQSLMQAGHLSSQRIEVTADNGCVTLNGEVQSFRRKLASQRVADSCAGVKSVVNNLKVTPPEPVSDLKIAEQVNLKLSDGSNLADNTIRVDVKNGTVTLSGYVSNSRDQKVAADIATSVDGVREIQDMLVINHDRVLANQEHSLAINAAMKRIIGMENEELQLSVVDDSARLSGVVDAKWKKEAAERNARQFGILKVCNEIVVKQTSHD